MAPNVDTLEPRTQELNDKLLNRLGLNEFMRELIPLHLHLYEIDLDKRFKKQKFIFKKHLPVFDYFKQTMQNLNLKFNE